MSTCTALPGPADDGDAGGGAGGLDDLDGVGGEGGVHRDVDHRVRRRHLDLRHLALRAGD